MKRTFRPYQWDAVRLLASYVLDGEPSLGLIAPTGAGKTTIVHGLLAKTRQHLTGAVIAAPSLSTEANFRANVVMEPEPSSTTGFVSVNVGLPISEDDFTLDFREDVGSDKEGAFSAVMSPSGADPSWFLTTHQQLALWGPDVLPTSTKGKLLVLDEAHHAGAVEEKTDEQEETRIGAFAEAWRERGGQVLYVTATPFRTDEKRVLLSSAVTYTRTIAEHASSAYAPNNFKVTTAILKGLSVNTSAQLAGDGLSVKDGQSGSFQAMVDRWVADGKPKAVFVVPQTGSKKWAARLVKALYTADPKIRVVDGVGTSNDVRDRFLAALEREQDVTRWEDSTVDVFIACKRFDEGTDWPLCSHVYNYGIPRSFGLIVQRWGRSFRDKSGIEGYPKALADEAAMVFFVPEVTEKVLDQFEQQHHDHAFLLACYLADWETARQYGTELRLRREKAWSRRSAPKTEAEQVERLKQDQMVFASDHLRPKVLGLIQRYEASCEQQGVVPEVRDVTRYLTQLGLSEEEMLVAGQVLLSRIPESNDEVEERLASLPSNPVRSDVYKLFREVVEQYNDKTVNILNGPGKNAASIYSEFTGTDAEEIGEKLRQKLQKPDLTEDMILDAALRYHYRTGGSEEDGFPGETLDDMFIRYGRTPVPWGELPVEKLGGRRRDHVKRTWPGAHSGDASLDFGFSETWRCVENSIHYWQRGITSSFASLSVAVSTLCGKGEVTLPVAVAAVNAFYRDNKDVPHKRTGNAAPYFGFPTTWGAVDAALRRRHNTSLKNVTEALCREMLNLRTVKAAMSQFKKDTGRFPLCTDGDASSYFGLPIRWSSLNATMLNGHRGFPEGLSLAKIRAEMGEKSYSRLLRPSEIVEAARLFEVERGRPPQRRDGDASHYFGFPITWSAVNMSLLAGLRGLAGGSSLHKLLVEHELKEG